MNIFGICSMLNVCFIQLVLYIFLVFYSYFVTLHFDVLLSFQVTFEMTYILPFILENLRKVSIPRPNENYLLKIQLMAKI